MSTLEVFAPRLCSVAFVHRDEEPEGCRLAADLEWVAAHGVVVRPVTLTEHPKSFVEHDAVRFLMNVLGADALPIVLVDGLIRSHGTYPDREQLAAWAGLEGELEQDVVEVTFLHSTHARQVLADAGAALEDAAREEVLESLARWGSPTQARPVPVDGELAPAG
jgi:hypothetical protein